MFLHCPANVLHCMCMLALLYRQRKAVDVCAGACHASARLNHAYSVDDSFHHAGHHAGQCQACGSSKRLCGTTGSAAPILATCPALVHILWCCLWPLPMLLRDAFQQVLWLVKVTSCRVRLTLQSARLEPSTSTAFCRIQHRCRGAAARRPRRAL